jgi:hypothetical protein
VSGRPLEASSGEVDLREHRSQLLGGGLAKVVRRVEVVDLDELIVCAKRVLGSNAAVAMSGAP